MDNKLMWLIVTWVALAVTMFGAMLVRKYMAREEDDFLHVSQATPDILNHQAETAQRMNSIDRWIRILLAAVILYGVAVGAVYLYEAWQSNLVPVR
ncbi:MAG: hypothetical protein ABJF23_05595 [Bryobacteraceae bacterium]